MNPWIFEALSAARSNGVYIDTKSEVDWLAMCNELKKHGRVRLSHLRIRSEQDARQNTLSALHGTGSFPFHTERAFEARPPRFSILYNGTDQSWSRPTLVANILLLDRQLRRDLAASKWLKRGVRNQAPLFGMFMTGRGNGYRIDFDFLQPVNEEASRCTETLQNELEAVCRAVKWPSRQLVIIDNWNIAHARGSEGDIEERALERLEYWVDAGMGI